MQRVSNTAVFLMADCPARVLTLDVMWVCRTWMEFGVHLGYSVNISAQWRERKCPSGVPTFFGFDTFTGLHAVLIYA